jgi:Domain of unknown function (DUF4157)
MKARIRRTRRRRKDSNADLFFQKEGQESGNKPSTKPFFDVANLVQTKLTIGKPNDPLEKQADAMADQVVSQKPPVQTMEEEETQTKPIQRMEEDEVQAKAETPTSAAPKSIETTLRSKKGKGQKLPQSTLKEMNHSFGTDFSRVSIHTDAETQLMNQQLKAQAFTHGADIYFNKGKYNPETTSGKHLLAHELTHTLQQKGASIKKLDDPKISTPVPGSAAKNKSTGVYKLTVNGVKVEIYPDVFVKGKSGGETVFKIIPKSWSFDGYDTDSEGKISKVKNAPKMPKVVIKTTYGLTVKPGGTSAYGRGTTAADKKAGNTSLRFHEGSHGSDFLDYLTNNPFPKFPNGVGMAEADFKKAVEKYKKERGEYGQKMQEFTDTRTECVGYTIDQYHKDNAKPGDTFPIVCGS